MRRWPDLRVYLIADPSRAAGRPLVEVVAAALEGGVTAVQLRVKGRPPGEVAALARELVPVARAAGVALVVNDLVQVAAATGADGVHVGRDDAPVTLARQLLGAGAVVGATAHGPEAARAAAAGGATYVGCRAYRSRTKPEGGDGVGPAGVGRVARAVAVPVVGVGGVRPGRAAPLVAAGAAGVAVCEAVMTAADPRDAARRLREEVDRALAALAMQTTEVAE